jgi:hypothetical protein
LIVATKPGYAEHVAGDADGACVDVGAGVGLLENVVSGGFTR